MPPAYPTIMQMAAMQKYAADMFELLEDLARKTGQMIVRAARNIPKVFTGTFLAVRGLISLLRNVSSQFSSIRNKAADALAPLRGLFSQVFSKKSVESVDKYTNSLTRINAANDGTQTNQELQEKIYAAAYRTRGNYMEMTDHVAKLSLSTPQVFSGNDEVIAFAELAQKAFRLGGAGGAEQQAGMSQLIDAMVEGKLGSKDFANIMDTAPMLAEAISGFTGKSKDELKAMSAEGLITTDTIKWALFGMADEINEKFNEMPKSFSDVGNQISTLAIRSFGPVMERVSQILNSEQGQQLIERISQAIQIASSLIGSLVDGIAMVVAYIADNWPVIEKILIAVGTVLLSMIIYQLWAMIPALVAQAASWLAMYLPILLIATVIALVIYALLQFGITAEQIVGFVFGLFAALGALIWNTIIGVVNGVIQYLWALIEPFVGLFEMILNVIHGGFDGFGGFLMNLAGQIISVFLSVGKVVSKILDSILGTKLTETLDKWQDEALSWGKNDKAITISRDIPMIGERMGVKESWNAGYQAGENLVSSIRNGLQGFKLDELEKEFEVPGGNSTKIDKINKVNEVGRINDTVDISSEDLKMMRELAEMNAIQNFVSLTPTVNVQTGDIRNGYDVDTIISRIEQSLTDQIASSAQGVYGLG